MTNVSAIAGSMATTAPTGTAGSTLNMTDFLKLMTTQLKTQDPFNPMDNTQMAAQMAQFSSVAGISEMNASLKTLATQLTGSRIGDAASWIGRSALVESNSATPLADGSYGGQITLPAAAASVTLSLVDADGNVVHGIDLGPQPAGAVDWAWAGTDAAGNPAGGGALKLVVTARDATGAAIAPTTASWAAIGGVQSPASGATKLVTPLGLIDPADAIRLG
ncbi:MAG: flagellar hook capping protein [Sphingomonas bacterium]|jgi:flagellar basal-body rod modification protein FlgD|nr:flagellar hook capping FlgD N-terminal domain-containing protein [Sphingomonas bacterium]MDB5690114.1 flagellar hook capping protein [Sphingomonas bacterium]